MVVDANDVSVAPDVPFGHLRTVKSSIRLDQIEKVRANGVGENVALPQLVVCGDQSAGKSSVLEGITQIPFPRHEGLCTRFPTEIILRNSASETTIITASIRPHASRSEEAQQTLLSYRKVVQDMSDLPSIIQEVSKLMNIRGYGHEGDGLAFAPDALRIEVIGPIGLHLSVVDLPGLISVANEEQDEEDVDAVSDMVNAYLQSSRTIILAVLQAGNDMANQPIIKMARKHDRAGQRTVGIITKADLINEGAEPRIALVARNQDTIKLKLGFFLVKNPSPLEVQNGISLETRSRRELQFFSTPAWKSQGIDTDRVGVDKLRLFLQDLLDTHIERELPKVRDEIRRMLLAREGELKALGGARVTAGEVRTYITHVSMGFYQLLGAASRGSYDGLDVEFFSKGDVCKLRARIQKLNSQFSDRMREHGQKRKIGSPVEAPDSDDESTDATAQLVVSKTEMMQWVKEAYDNNRGIELPGTHNAALLAELYRVQCQRWHTIAEDHVDSILHAVSAWVDHALTALIAEERLRVEVHRILNDWIDRAKQLALEELSKLMEDERDNPSTYNHYYTDNVQKARVDRLRGAIKYAVAQVTRHDKHGNPHVSDDLERDENFVATCISKSTSDMVEEACNEALTQLQAYYKVARKTFVDNVARQVINRHIMRPLPKAFSPESVSSLSDEEVQRIGSEPAYQTTRRKTLGKEAEDLRRSLRALQNVS
ncbi:hypothetical protein K4F52_010309 [Lecanicillium sp. MT-2017a]|nr:hypothetical protein K4F52_010309 [Lecanicillium sp. MT-2017a]